MLAHRCRPRMGGLFVAMSIAWLPGCFFGGDPAPPTDPRYLGEFPGLATTTNEKLRAEYEKIVATGDTPETLSPQPVPDKENVGEGLRGLFSPEELPAIMLLSEDLAGRERLPLRDAPLRQAGAFLLKHENARRRARDALGRPQCDFRLDLAMGSMVDTSLSDTAVVLARLESIRAWEHLSINAVDEAMTSWEAMMRLAECLAAEPRPTIRADGAYIRNEAMVVFFDISQSDQFTREHLGRGYRLAKRQIDQWPADELTWRADRLLGMHLYETVRFNGIGEILTADEIRQFQDEGLLEDINPRLARTIDRDELHYLVAMDAVIAECQKPFYERREVFQRITDELVAKKKAGSFPLIAGRLLLPTVLAGHELQARDRAQAEGWLLALAHATGEPSPPLAANPLSGQPYRIIAQADRVTVPGVGSGLPGDLQMVSVPVFGSP